MHIKTLLCHIGLAMAVLCWKDWRRILMENNGFSCKIGVHLWFIIFEEKQSQADTRLMEEDCCNSFICMPVDSLAAQQQHQIMLLVHAGSLK